MTGRHRWAGGHDGGGKERRGGIQVRTISGIKSTQTPRLMCGCVENDWLLFHIWKSYIVHIGKDGQRTAGAKQRTGSTPGEAQGCKRSIFEDTKRSFQHAPRSQCNL